MQPTYCFLSVLVNSEQEAHLHRTAMRRARLSDGSTKDMLLPACGAKTNPNVIEYTHDAVHTDMLLCKRCFPF